MYARVLIFLSLLGLCWGCSREEEKIRLEHRLNSVRQELEASRKDVETLLQIGLLLDSIDRNRYDLLVDWREQPTPFNKYKYRLRAINNYVVETEMKIHYLHEQIDRFSSKDPNAAETIARFKERIRQRSREIRQLKAQLSKYTEENQALYQRVNQQDAEFDQHENRLREQEQSLEVLRVRVDAARQTYQEIQAESCYRQARALEELANRTKFAGARKRETLQQALALYRQALHFGNEEARTRIEELEKLLN